MPNDVRALHCWAGNLHGGVETFLATLARDQAAAPNLTQEFLLCFEGRLSADLRRIGADVHQAGSVRFSRPWTIPRARARFARVLADRRVDLVVTHGCWPHALFAPVAQRKRRPVAFWMHDLAKGDHWIDRTAARARPDLAIVNSHFTATTLPRLFPKSPHEVLYYPVDAPPATSSDERERVRSEHATDSDAVVIVQASRLERWKGQTLLLDALGRLRQTPGWVAWIAGGAQRPHELEYLNELRERAERAGVADRVRFLGQCSDVPRLLAAADVHCQPNTGPEPFGIAYVEALHAGLPVVATRMGGALEIIDERCGVLVSPDDPPALADALERLIKDAELRRRLGRAGPDRARELCDPRSAIERFARLARGLVEANAPR